MIKVIIGIALVVWSLWAGMGTRELNRAQIFQGPVGTLVNLIVLLAGLGLVVSAFF